MLRHILSRDGSNQTFETIILAIFILFTQLTNSCNSHTHTPIQLTLILGPKANHSIVFGVNLINNHKVINDFTRKNALISVTPKNVKRNKLQVWFAYDTNAVGSLLNLLF